MSGWKRVAAPIRLETHARVKVKRPGWILKGDLHVHVGLGVDAYVFRGREDDAILWWTYFLLAP